MNHSEDIVPYENKSFDELLQEIKKGWFAWRGASKLVPLLWEKGHADGLSDEEIRQKVIHELGMPYKTMIRYVPESSKRTYVRYQNRDESRKREDYQQEEQPKIPPPPQPIIEQRQEPTLTATEEPQEFKLPMKLVDDFMNKAIYIVRAKTWARTNGLDYLTFKANSEGVLSLNVS
jgi:hypothetical protein